MKKISFCIIISLMMIFTWYTPAYAQYTPINGGTFQIKHYFVMDKHANVPQMTFNGRIEPVPKSGGIEEGPGGATIDNIAYTPDDTTYDTVQTGDDVILDENQKYAKGVLTVNMTNAFFNEPGTYRYMISGTKTGASDGVTTSQNLYLDVYVIHDENTGGLRVSSTFLHLINSTQKVTAITDEYISKDLRITKTVTGSQGSHFEDFTFTVYVDGGTGKRYLVRADGNADQVIRSQSSATFTLKHGKIARIYGLSEGDKYTVTESNAENYTTSYTVNDGEVTVRSTTGERIMGTVQNNVNFTNTRGGDEPVTGIILNRLPYIIMIALVIGFGGLFLFKKSMKINNK